MRKTTACTAAMVLVLATVPTGASAAQEPPAPGGQSATQDVTATPHPAHKFKLDTNLLTLGDAAGTGRNMKNLSLGDLLPAKADLARELRLAAWSDPVDRIPYHLETAGLFGPPPPAGAGWPGRIGVMVPLVPVIDKDGRVKYTLLTPWSERWSDLSSADKVGVAVQDMVAIGTLVMLLRGLH